MAATIEELGQAVASEASLRLTESVKKIRHCLCQPTDEQEWTPSTPEQGAPP